MPAPQYYFGPGNANTPLGTPDDKWAGINAKTATIDTFKNVGNSSTPVYFDANGIPQPVTSISLDDNAKRYYIIETKDNGEVVLRPVESSGESDTTIIATEEDINKLTAKFAISDKVAYDDVVATNEDTKQLINKFI